ncbi:MAG: helix-turn-helix domain-containing protein [Ruminococcaceae bacterium]|nr:helix-turn-helix domain-containing protein [Oscillospiraceae bacterium]
MYQVTFLNRGFLDINPFEYGEEKCEKNHEYGPNYRNNYLIHYVISGEGIFEHGGKTYNLSKGDCFFIKPNEIVHYKADEKNPWHYTWIGFSAHKKLHKKLDRDVIYDCGFESVFDEMRKILDMERGKEDYLCGCIWKLLSLIKTDEESAFDYVEQAKAYINAEYSHDLKIHELSRYLNLDRTYFSALFKQKTGKSPQQYLIETRLSRAAELITKFNFSPTVAASSVGYSDLFSFSRMFKRHFGVSPSEYKKQYREHSLFSCE